ncbi:MAG: peptide-methionine (S)-S-oxide reductase MsrA [Gemmatimonadaceae bacterium]
MLTTFSKTALVGAGMVAAWAFAVRAPSPTPRAALPAPLTGHGVAAVAGERVAYFAGGCFWGVEAVFEHLKGVKEAVSGYAGGKAKSPSYEEVSSGDTGHAESVRVVYDPSVISYEQLLQVFFSVAHDPTQLNRQGPDVGTQYRSIAFYQTDDEKKAIESYISQLTTAKAFKQPIVTQVLSLGAFYPAEAYHQDYLAHHPTQPYIVYNDAPKLEHLKQAFPALYKS